MKPDSLLWNLASLLWEIVWTQQGFQIFDTILWLALTLIAVINCTVSKLIRTKTSRIIAINQTGYRQVPILYNNNNFKIQYNSKLTPNKTEFYILLNSTKTYPIVTKSFSMTRSQVTVRNKASLIANEAMIMKIMILCWKWYSCSSEFTLHLHLI